MLAADMRSGLAAFLADGVGEGAPRLDPDRMVLAVNLKRDVGFAHAVFPLLRNAARIRCGVAGTSSMDTPNGDSASLIALITAAGAPIAPPSPRPLALVSVLPVRVA